MTASTESFRAARDFLLDHRDDYATAYRDFTWPELATFNWALDWFDVLGAERPDERALWLVGTDGADGSLTFAEMSSRSNQVANFLRTQGVRRGDRVLLVLANIVPLWETMLAACKLGAVVIPATTLLGPNDLVDRIDRGAVRHVVTSKDQVQKFDGITGDWTRTVIGQAEGWTSYSQADQADTTFVADGTTNANDELLLYFTSGTTALPKLVEHTHQSYPVGHLSTMYWIGLRPGDIHLNVSSPGWAKHAWSSLFAPWNAGACILVFDSPRFDAQALLDVMRRCEVTTFCAPPTVWRMLIQQDLSAYQLNVRELASAGEPLNPEVIEQVRAKWGLTIRDGYGQTETTAQIGNPPGQELRLGSMGRPLPGYPIALVDPISGEVGPEGEICIDLSRRPTGLMTGYRDDASRTSEAMAGGFYHTGDVASVDADGFVTYVGRSDDVFKASDYRISPFELESVLIEHPYVAEAAVVPAPDPLRLAVPKAYVVLAGNAEPTAELAFDILRHAREQLAPYKRVRRLEFGDLPKTISGKIRRVELRTAEAERTARNPHEYWEEDFPDLKA
ncbi:AMP-binding protein [Tenggerimyces flavus]|uniref:AMP-binding protein n=1 Tax=Tenggerimyces flavus TaxID=1708749 RepID=A0ABV7YIQ4_9ACTN|nr:AMP-binding protein [Tenggerimyces flavus]MBM7787254.1 acetyl-CoA synthetase [Tenggerimyces flavus]